jgi:hypothetical protein
MNAILSANPDTLWFDVCEWDGWKKHDLGLHPALPFFKHHVPVGSTTKLSFWLLVAAACGAANAEELGFIPQNLDTTGNISTTNPNTTGLQNVNSLATPEITSQSELCLHGETHWCGAYYAYGDLTVGCDPGNSCKYVACTRANILEINYVEHMRCLRAICPPKYSAKYVECATDMATEQADCLRNLGACSDQDIQNCYFKPEDRFQWMQDCLQ